MFLNITNLFLFLSFGKFGAVFSHGHQKQKERGNDQQIVVKKLGMEIVANWEGTNKVVTKKNFEKIANSLSIDSEECEKCLSDLFEEAAHLNKAEANLFF